MNQATAFIAYPCLAFEQTNSASRQSVDLAGCNRLIWQGPGFLRSCYLGFLQPLCAYTLIGAQQPYRYTVNVNSAAGRRVMV